METLRQTVMSMNSGGCVAVMLETEACCSWVVGGGHGWWEGQYGLYYADTVTRRVRVSPGSPDAGKTDEVYHIY